MGAHLLQHQVHCHALRQGIEQRFPLRHLQHHLVAAFRQQGAQAHTFGRVRVHHGHVHSLLLFPHAL
ncbi:MAG: hypothetical protein IPP26_11900 [Flavobacteriales bacterium]|nr:hypothetical protein [Flavobacteriales bacterium]